MNTMTSSTPIGHAADPRRPWSVRHLIAAGVLGLLAALPLLAAWAGDAFYVTLFSRIMIFGLAALGLNLVLGYGGLVSFGHALYMGLGAYAVGILSFHGVGNGYVHLAVALGAGAVVALVVGAICLRTRGVAFIMITLAFAQMFFFLAVSMKQYGGDDGLGMSTRSDFGVVDLNDDVTLYYVIFAVLVLTLWAFQRLVNSRFGMVLRGSKSNDRRMLALGFPTGRVKLLAYVISALVCVIAGVLLANLTRFVSPSYMQWSTSGEILLMAVLGGLGSLLGPLIGAGVWLMLEEWLSSFSVGLPDVLQQLVRDHWMGLLGLFIVVVTLTMKSGLYGHLVERDEERA